MKNRIVMRARGGSGLGDSLYLRPVCEWLAANNPSRYVVPLTNHPDIFIGSGMTPEPHQKCLYDVLSHYTARRPFQDTTQWYDICVTAGVPHALNLGFEWTVINNRLLRKIKELARGRPVVMLNGGRPPMGRTDGYSDEMLPDKHAFYKVLGELSDCFIVKVGKGPELYPLHGSMDLTNNTTVADLIDIAQISSALVGQCSFMVPLAECFDKPFIGVWAQRGLVSATPFIKQCTPAKILSKPSTSMFVIDNWDDAAIAGVVAAARMKFPLETL